MANKAISQELISKTINIPSKLDKRINWYISEIGITYTSAIVLLMSNAIDNYERNSIKMIKEKMKTELRLAKYK